MIAPPAAPATIVVATSAPIAAQPAAPVVSGFTTIWGITINPSVIVLVVFLGGLAYMLYRGQRDHGRNSFDFWDLVMDTLPEGQGRRTSVIKTTFLIAFGLSSWVVIDQQIKGTLTEGVFGLYLATWGASLIAKVVFDKKDPPALAGGKP